MNIASALTHRHAGDPITFVFGCEVLLLAGGISWMIVRFLPRPSNDALYRGWRAAQR
jgi:hypothetical protein